MNRSDTAKSTANSANATAGAANATASSANNTAGAAQSTAAAAQSTASQALSTASIADEVRDNFSFAFDPDSISATSCVSESRSRLGVLTSDEVIVTPPNSQPLGIIVQAKKSSSSGQVTLVFCNVTNSSIDPPSGSYEFSTLR